QFINVYTGMVNEKSAIQDILYECMWNGDLESIVKAVKRLFAGTPSKLAFIFDIIIRRFVCSLGRMDKGCSSF
ncbi:hypothetical protein FLX35_04485, partial [Cylindrospermopsis raciborskii LB2897]|nr:hypothetical protein [Cylindrospermopsis raciborskii LB2897]